MDIDTVARLTRIALTADEAARYGQELARVLSFVEALDALDLDDVGPTRHVVPVETPTRADEVGPTLQQSEALANAPVHDDTSFVVPKVV